MLSCKEITELAASAVEGALEPDARRRFDLHVASCSGCRTWLEQQEIATSAIRALPPPVLPAALHEQLLGRFDHWQATRTAPGRPAAAATAGQGSRYTWEALIAVVGVAALLAAMARNPSSAAADWVVAMGLAAGAVALAFLARRLTPGFAVTAVSAALVAAAVRGGPGPLELGEGLECLAIEVAAAAAVAGTAWFAGRRTPGPVALGPWAVAGSLAGTAALQVACGAHTSLAHLVTFHAGGVLLVAAVTLAGTRLRPQPA
jgi:hypothetical protein